MDQLANKIRVFAGWEELQKSYFVAEFNEEYGDLMRRIE